MSAASRIPRHLAVIMDGNGRWAQQRHRPRAIGHRAGARAVNLCIDFCLDAGIGALTLFAFSSENWGRPEDEVGGLMKLFMNALDREVGELHRRGVRVRFIGERSRFGAAIASPNRPRSPMKRTRTPRRWSSSTSRSRAFMKSFIRAPTSSCGRPQFSLEKANSVRAPMPLSRQKSMQVLTARAPAGS